MSGATKVGNRPATAVAPTGPLRNGNALLAAAGGSLSGALSAAGGTAMVICFPHNNPEIGIYVNPLVPHVIQKSQND